MADGDDVLLPSRSVPPVFLKFLLQMKEVLSVFVVLAHGINDEMPLFVSV